MFHIIYVNYVTVILKSALICLVVQLDEAQQWMDEEAVELKSQIYQG